MKIRFAVLTDITGIIIFCDKHQDLLRPSDPHLNKRYFRRQLHNAMRSDDSKIFIAINKKGELCGVLWAWIAGYCWSPMSYVTDILFLADQGGNYLMNKMMQWAKSKGAPKAIMQTHLEFESDRVKKLFHRKNFSEVGTVFERQL